MRISLTADPSNLRATAFLARHLISRELGPEESSYQVYLTNEKKLAPARSSLPEAECLESGRGPAVFGVRANIKHRTIAAGLRLGGDLPEGHRFDSERMVIRIRQGLLRF